jgi:hypothetical protein
MNALLLLTAGLTAGDLPPPRSAAADVRLDLSGEWDGTFETTEGVQVPLRLSGGSAELCPPGTGLFLVTAPRQVVVTGSGPSA